MAKRIDKKERAMMQVMSDMGEKPKRIGRLMNRSPHTIKAHLQQQLSDSETQEMIEVIKQHELQQLQGIGYKARTILDNYLDAVLNGEKEANPISITAILDRTFQQKRLIQGESTHNISQVISAIHAEIESIDKQLLDDE